eukprot:6178395-Pleurochrysis_carterae.AAC.2
MLPALRATNTHEPSTRSSPGSRQRLRRRCGSRRYARLETAPINMLGGRSCDTCAERATLSAHSRCIPYLQSMSLTPHMASHIRSAEDSSTSHALGQRGPRCLFRIRYVTTC